ncbi:transposase [Halobacterium salinarum]|uniref:ISH7-type transposase n=3 Tax=Halobacterium salinarum TaxID=2242 RepID=B0RA51_HALS3|nr:transposase [Halobacterium salinarum]MDL0120961.1 transposase [Halobacterium salinarum]MDL0130950.1 transposase [Halobacterium salinarum]MDL0133815.1 transposase [Halobacterium salinarum]MDL0141558.1 transposase [Halobacterium salinarum]CAP15669.1 ISH7-type transposase [Halobacterium salinarum R1]
MVATCESRRSVFRRIAHQQRVEWPAYDSTPLYDRSSLSGLESDVRVVSSVWFTHPNHNSLEQLVCSIPLAYFRFEPHDCYGSSTRYEMDTLFRVFMLKELHGWQHETSLVEYLDSHPELCERLGLESAPNQSTLWRTWNERFTGNIRETIQKAARTILIKAQNADVAVPREPERNLSHRGDDADESVPNDQAILDKAERVTDHISRVVFPAFSLNRGEGCEIPENAYWGLQTYLGLRENLAANEGARSFIHESTRERTPLGHGHRDQIRDLSIERIREMYRQAVQQLINELARTEEFFRAGIVAIDITEDDPFTGDRTGHEDEIIGTKEKTDEYAYQWATVQLVGNAVPLVLDARPVRKGESRKEIVEDLLNSAEELVHVDNVLMDREFDSQHLLEMISQRGLSYVVPKRMQASEKAQAKRLLQRGQDRYETDRKLHLGKNEWHETTLIYRRKENSEHDDHRQYSVFMSNRGGGFLSEYGHRWEIESGYRSIKRFMAATTSTNFGLRFFYFAFACLLYSIWRAVDLLVQVELTGEYEHAPMVTADNTLTLLKKETGIG